MEGLILCFWLAVVCWLAVCLLGVDFAKLETWSVVRRGRKRRWETRCASCYLTSNPCRPCHSFPPQTLTSRTHETFVSHPRSSFSHRNKHQNMTNKKIPNYYNWFGESKNECKQNQLWWTPTLVNYDRIENSLLFAKFMFI